MPNDDYRAEQAERREHGLKARHEQRLENATYTAAEVKVLTAKARQDAAEEIARAIELHQTQFHREGPVYTELEYCVETARGIAAKEASA